MRITLEDFNALREQIVEAGHAETIDWAETVGPPADAIDFASETIYVIVNSGMKWQIARQIYKRISKALVAGDSAGTVFGHAGKVSAIDRIWQNRQAYFENYMAADDKLQWLRGLPWIGPITCFHLAKNLGLDFVKPDRHLVRIAQACGETPESLCGSLSEASGLRIGTVAYILWQAANLGIIDTRSLT